MNIIIKFVLLFVIIIGLIVGKNSIYYVRADQYAIVTQEGGIISRKSNEPGLSFKLPFIQEVHYLPRAIVFEWKNDALLVQAHGPRSILINAYLLWTIEDPEKYFNFVGESVDINDKLGEMTTEKYRSLHSKDTNDVKNKEMFKQSDLSDNNHIEEELKKKLSEIGIKAIKIKLKMRMNHQ